MYFGQCNDERLRVILNYGKLLGRMGCDGVIMHRAAPKGTDISWRQDPRRVQWVRQEPRYRFRNDE